MINKSPIKKVEKFEDGAIQSIERPLYTREEAINFLLKIHAINVENKLDKAGAESPIIYRYILRRTAHDPIETQAGKIKILDTKDMILDVVLRGSEYEIPKYTFLIFENMDELNAYYKNLGEKFLQRSLKILMQ